MTTDVRDEVRKDVAQVTTFLLSGLRHEAVGEEHHHEGCPEDCDGPESRGCHDSHSFQPFVTRIMVLGQCRPAPFSSGARGPPAQYRRDGIHDLTVLLPIS